MSEQTEQSKQFFGELPEIPQLKPITVRCVEAPHIEPEDEENE